MQANAVVKNATQSSISSLSEKFNKLKVELKEQSHVLQNQQQQVHQQQAINDTFAFINPETYTKYSRDLKANKSKQLREKENLTDEKNPNESNYEYTQGTTYKKLLLSNNRRTTNKLSGNNILTTLLLLESANVVA